MVRSLPPRGGLLLVSGVIGEAAATGGHPPRLA